MNRYMLPVFAICCPGAAVVTAIGEKIDFGRFIRSVICFLCALELFGLLNYHGKIMLDQMRMADRAEGYYYKREEAYDQYKMLKAYILDESPEKVGMITSSEAFKYPVWNMLHNYNIDGVVIVPGESRNMDCLPDAVFTIGVNMEDSFYYSGKEYKKEFSLGKKCSIYR